MKTKRALIRCSGELLIRSTDMRLFPSDVLELPSDGKRGGAVLVTAPEGLWPVTVHVAGGKVYRVTIDFSEEGDLGDLTENKKSCIQEEKAP